MTGPRSVSWRVNREAALLLGGGRALLMQVAHPRVAAGVAEHSDFESDPIRRLNLTLELSLALTFGTPEQVRSSAERINRTHQRVSGKGYRALDPDLLLWVHATLIDSALLSYRTFVGPLAPSEAEAYYQEAKPIGALLGVLPRLYPATLPAFEGYLEAMLAGPVRPDATGLRLAGQVLRPPIRWVPGALFAPLRVLTAGLLPEALREAYGLAWGHGSRAVFRAASAGARRLVAVAPARLRVVPPARAAERALESGVGLL